MLAPRRIWLIALLAAFAVFYGLAGHSTYQALFGPSPGLFFYDDLTEDRTIGAAAATHAAAAQLQGLQGLLRVERIDGVAVQDVPGRGPGPVRVRRAALASEPTLVQLVDEQGTRREVLILDGDAELSAIPGVVYVGLAYGLVGLFYLAVGLFVWLRRPDEASAPWLLVLGIVAATQLAQPAPDTALGWALNAYIAAAMFPLYGPIVVGLGFAFTGTRPSSNLRLARRMLTVSAAALVVALPFILHRWAFVGHGGWAMRAYMLGVGLELGLCLVLFMVVAARAMGAEQPPLMRRRARLLAFATGIAFGFPALELVVLPFVDSPPVELVAPNLLCFVAFPVTIGYAILRYQAFDLRVVFRRGVVYAVLSLLVSLAFVGAVLLLVGLVGNRAQSASALWVTSLVLVVGVGLLQLRVQSLVDRWAHRKQARYARGIEEVAEELVRAHTLDELSKIAARALIEVMELSRAYVAMREGEQVSCFLLANLDDPKTGRAPEQVPASFSLSSMRPLERAASLEEMTTAYDADALPSMAGAKPLPGDFWSTYGLEVVVPLLRRVEGGQAVIGFLLLGPRLDGQPLDDQDRALVRQLSNQLTVAAENTLAFEQIRALKDGLEEKVKARTRELERALDELKSAEAQIIESEKQAMLGRLVAGIVHEVNTPLGALQSSADTLGRLVGKLDAELPPDAPGRRRLRMGAELTALQVTSATRISEIMASLRSFVSLDEGELREVDVREGIDSALALLGPEIGDGVRVVRDYPARVPAVRAHAQRLNQVFLHLLNNALKAVDGAGEIRILVEAQDRGICIHFSDDGPGIPVERRQDLFEFGFTKKSGRVGLRLGLPTSARTVRELGGDIRVQSEVGEGTKVQVDLPTGP